MKNSKLLVPLILLIVSCKKYNEERIHINLSPNADAGTDQIIRLPTNSVYLNGGLSVDVDGKIVKWQWTKISGPSFFAITNADAAVALVEDLREGSYQFELKISDTKGLVDKDTLQVEVKPSFGNVVFFCPDPTGSIQFAWQTWDNGDAVNGLKNLITIKINNQSGILAGVWCKNGCAPQCPLETDYNMDPGNYISFDLAPATYTWSAENTITNFTGWPEVTSEFKKFFGDIHKVQGTITVNEGDNCIIEPIIF